MIVHYEQLMSSHLPTLTNLEPCCNRSATRMGKGVKFSLVRGFAGERNWVSMVFTDHGGGSEGQSDYCQYCGTQHKFVNDGARATRNSDDIDEALRDIRNFLDIVKAKAPPAPAKKKAPVKKKK